MESFPNIVLIGMPAVGKSTVGHILAQTLAYDYLDTDALIEAKEGRSLSDIISLEGLAGFCAIEEKIVRGIDVHRTVISTGGSVVYGNHAMVHLKKIGVLIYLNADLDLLVSRLKNPTQRGVVQKPGQTFDMLLSERHKLYSRYADIIVDCPPGDIPEVTAARVIEKLSI